MTDITIDLAEATDIGRYNGTQWSRTWQYIRRWCHGWELQFVLELLGYTPHQMDRWADGRAPQPDDLDHWQAARVNKAVEIIDAKMKRRWWPANHGRRYEWREDKKMIEVPWPNDAEHPGEVAPVADIQAFRNRSKP